MHLSRLALLAAAQSLAFAAVHVAPAAGGYRYYPGARRAALLPEVQKHLDAAHDCASNGSPQVAAAHADLVLVGDAITVSVQFVGVSDRLHDRCTKALDGAMDAWTKALDGTVEFRNVTDPARADIVIRFKPSVLMGKEQVAGYANWKRLLKSDGGHLESSSFKADLQIRTSNLDGRPMPFDCVRHEIAHEIGHILGLEDSDAVGDLMGPLDVDHPVEGPLPFEALAVKQLRDEAHRIRTEALAKIRG